jgi:hypothetical protein
MEKTRLGLFRLRPLNPKEGGRAPKPEKTQGNQASKLIRKPVFDTALEFVRGFGKSFSCYNFLCEYRLLNVERLTGIDGCFYRF